MKYKVCIFNDEDFLVMQGEFYDKITLLKFLAAWEDERVVIKREKQEGNYAKVKRNESRGTVD